MELTQQSKICPFKLIFNNESFEVKELIKTNTLNNSVKFDNECNDKLDTSILRSKMIFIFYVLGSIVEGKPIIPKSSSFINRSCFDKNKFQVIQDIFLDFIKSEKIKDYLSDLNYNNLNIMDGFSFYIATKINQHNSLFFPKYININKNIMEIIKNIEADNFKVFSDDLKLKLANIEFDIIFNRLAAYLYKFFYKKNVENLSDFIDPFDFGDKNDDVYNFYDMSIYNNDLYHCFKGSYHDEFRQSDIGKLIKFIFSKYDYYRLSDKDSFFGPLDYNNLIIEKESEIFSTHLKSLNCEYIPHFIKYFKMNHCFSSTDKKIVNNILPREIKVFDNYSYLNLLTYLKKLEVNNNMLSSVLSLKNSFPHFSDVIDYFDVSIRANFRKNNELKFKPILLIGDNGIGKSAFIDEINKIFKLSNNIINIGSITTPAEISGSTSLWNSGQPGFISKVIINNNVYNPIVILEELDKVMTSNTNGRIMSPLYDLFEKRSAEKFFENFYAIPLDFSDINFIATANTYENIDKGVLHRFKIFKIERPHEDELFDIVKSVYKNIKDNDLFDIVEINEVGLKAISNSFIHQKIRNIRVIHKFIEDILMEALYHNKTDKVYVIDYLDDSYITHSNMVH